MRRTLCLGLSVIGAALALSPLVSSAGAKRPARQAPEKVFTLYAFGRGAFIPAPGTNPKRPAPGDVFVINDHLTLPFAEHGKYKIVGHDTGTCVFTRVGRHGGALANCTVTAVLPHGTLTGQGQLKFTPHAQKTSHLAITGGTGAFRGAEGAVQVVGKKRFTVLTFTVR